MDKKLLVLILVLMVGLTSPMAYPVVEAKHFNTQVGIQRQLDRLPSWGGIVELELGAYEIKEPVILRDLTGGAITFRGQGAGLGETGTVLYHRFNGDMFIFEGINRSINFENIYFSSNQQFEGRAISIPSPNEDDYAADLKLRHVYFKGFKQAIYAKTLWSAKFEDVRFYKCGDNEQAAIELVNSKYVLFDYTIIEGNYYRWLDVQNSKAIGIVSGIALDPNGTEIYIYFDDQSVDSWITGGYWAGATEYQVWLNRHNSIMQATVQGATPLYIAYGSRVIGNHLIPGEGYEAYWHSGGAIIEGNQVS